MVEGKEEGSEEIDSEKVRVEMEWFVDLSFTEKDGCKEGADSFWGSCALHVSFCLLHLAFHVDLLLQGARPPQPKGIFYLKWDPPGPQQFQR